MWLVRALAHAALDLLSPPTCSACDAPLGRDAVFCAGCLHTLEEPPPLPVGTTASFAYGGAVAEAVRRLKFGGRVDLLRPLRRLVVERLPPLDVDAVVPLPLHPRKVRSRGFDQVSLLSTAVASALRRPLVLDLLHRPVETPSVARLSAHARRDAVRDAFRASPRAAGLRLLLVDDVRTTGSTLDEATLTLVARGAHVRAHVLAATP